MGRCPQGSRYRTQSGRRSSPLASHSECSDCAPSHRTAPGSKKCMHHYLLSGHRTDQLTYRDNRHAIFSSRVAIHDRLTLPCAIPVEVPPSLVLNGTVDGGTTTVGILYRRCGMSTPPLLRCRGKTLGLLDLFQCNSEMLRPLY